MKLWSKSVWAAAAVALFGLGLAVGAHKYETPGTVIHVVTVKWNESATPQQRQAAIDGVRKMASEIPGIRRIWLKTLKVQPDDYHAAFVMEFENQKALADYAPHPGHRAWEEIYFPVRGESRSHDITN